jgi:hypothetical protein
MNAEALTVRRNGKEALEVFERELEELLADHRHPAERRIRYGNLRCEISEAGEKLMNAAVVYETPGGSTTQINVICDEEAGSFSYLSRDLESTEISEDPLEVVAMIRHHADAIPDKRLTALFNQIDVWLAEGKTRSEMFGEMNKLLQTEFLGGRIANEELKAGIQHIVRKYSRQAS